MIAIMDYDVGNLGSIKNALDYLKFENVITSDRSVILKADKIILPGVGAFKDAMEAFKRKGFVDVINEAINKAIPILGICVGMQILFTHSHENGVHDGLDIIKGEVVKFDKNIDRVPHVGWNQITITKDNPLLKELDGSYVYFVHSYYVNESEYMISKTEYAGKTFCSAICHKNIYATQFHPEKSGKVGLKILKNFGDL